MGWEDGKSSLGSRGGQVPLSCGGIPVYQKATTTLRSVLERIAFLTCPLSSTPAFLCLKTVQAKKGNHRRAFGAPCAAQSSVQTVRRPYPQSTVNVVALQGVPSSALGTVTDTDRVGAHLVDGRAVRGCVH